jgi:hypothetical protein
VTSCCLVRAKKFGKSNELQLHFLLPQQHNNGQLNKFQLHLHLLHQHNTNRLYHNPERISKYGTRLLPSLPRPPRRNAQQDLEALHPSLSTPSSDREGRPRRQAILLFQNLFIDFSSSTGQSRVVSRCLRTLQVRFRVQWSETS